MRVGFVGLGSMGRSMASALLRAHHALVSLVRDRMLAALARGYGELDWASFARIAAEEAGVSPASAGT